MHPVSSQWLLFRHVNLILSYFLIFHVKSEIWILYPAAQCSPNAILSRDTFSLWNWPVYSVHSSPLWSEDCLWYTWSSHWKRLTEEQHSGRRATVITQGWCEKLGHEKFIYTRIKERCVGDNQVTQCGSHHCLAISHQQQTSVVDHSPRSTYPIVLQTIGSHDALQLGLMQSGLMPSLFTQLSLVLWTCSFIHPY